MPLRALGGLFAPPLGVASQGQRGVEGPRVVAAVVDHRDLGRPRAHVPGELVAADEVAAAQLGGIHPELLREMIERPLGREDGLRLARAPVGRRRRLAGEGRPHAAGVVPQPVGPGQARGGDRRTEHAQAPAVGAHVGEDLRPHAEQGSVAPRRQLDVVPLLARVGGGREVLAPGLHPLDRPGEAHGQQGQHQLFGVDLLLDAEPPADVRRHHADPVLVETEHVAQHVADRVGPLRGRPHGEVSGARVVGRHDAPGLQRDAAVALDVVAPARDHVRGAERGVGIADPLREVGGQIVAQVIVQDGRVRSDGEPGVGNDGERVVLDPHRRGGVLGRVPIAGHHRRDRLADVANRVARPAGGAGTRAGPGER